MKNLFMKPKLYRVLSILLLIIFVASLFRPMGTLVLKALHSDPFPIAPAPIYLNGVSLLNLAQGGQIFPGYIVAAQPLAWIIALGSVVVLFSMLRGLKRSIHFVEGIVYAGIVLIVFATLQLIPHHLSDPNWETINLTDTTTVYVLQSILLVTTTFLILIGGVVDYYFDKSHIQDNLEYVYSTKHALHDWKI